MSPTRRPSDPAAARNGRVVLICVTVLALMTGAAFASVPLYRAFCQATGFSGAVPTATKASRVVLERRVTVRFDTNVRDLPWSFAPVENQQSIHIGESGLAFFKVTNNSDKPLTGRAAYNVAPLQAGAYFRKLQCFCFNDQTIAAHTTVQFPVVYFVDPGFAKDPDMNGMSDVTLSYTFYPSVSPTQKVASKPAQGLGGTAGAAL
ncbi:MAG: cytochrome c oxidase assembly protein [Caulobacteraceae bacterium]|nr:cytochrome c oxidase assembly protein [Caulobacteraceae bacterium]